MTDEIDTGPKTRSWKQNPDAVKADILSAARAEFAQNGLSGARVERIVKRTMTSKRMIFYYFGDKLALYQAVLHDAYAQVRRKEEALDLGDLPPAEALSRLIRFTFDHHRDNPDFIRLVMIENIHHGQNLAGGPPMTATNRPIIDKLDRILKDGAEQGLFRDGLSAMRLHWHISALSFFNVSNRATFAMSFGDDLFRPTAQAEVREEMVTMLLRHVSRKDADEPPLSD